MRRRKSPPSFIRFERFNASVSDNDDDDDVDDNDDDVDDNDDYLKLKFKNQYFHIFL